MIEPRCLIAPQLRSTLFPDHFAADRKWFRGGTQHGFMPRLRRRGISISRRAFRKPLP